MELTGLYLIEDYRKHPERYFPLMDHTEEMPPRNEFGEENLGWNVGMLDSRRPYFLECWRAFKAIIFTVYVSSQGIEDMTARELDAWLQDIEYYTYYPGVSPEPRLGRMTDPQGNEFFFMTVVADEDEGILRIEDYVIRPWTVLNKFNQEYYAKEPLDKRQETDLTNHR